MLVASCLGASACDRVFGLSRDDAQVTGSFLARTLHNSDDGAPVSTDEPFPPDEVGLEVRFADGSQREVLIDADGNFAFATPTTDELYTLTIRTTAATVYQSTARELVLIERIPGRLGRVDPPPGTRLDLTVVNRNSVRTSERIGSTGVWSSTLASGTLDIDWSNVLTVSDKAGLLDDDDVWFLSYAQGPTPFKYQRLAQSARSPRVRMTAGMGTTLTMTAMNSSFAQCAHFLSKNKTEAERLTSLAPTFSWNGATNWKLIAMPDLSYAIETGFVLAEEFSVLDVVDADVTLMYTNPFPGHTVIARMDVQGNAGTLPGDSRTVFEVPADCSPVDLTGTTAALPVAITVAGTRLAGNETLIDVDRRADVPISWTATEGRADQWSITLSEAVGSTTTARFKVFTTEPRLMLDPDLLSTGRQYYIHIRTHFGTPNAPTGDFATGTLPRGSTGVYSTSFTVR